MPAAEKVTGVQFVNTVRFNMNEHSRLDPERDKCTLERVVGGVEAKSDKQRIFVPYANIKFVVLGSVGGKE